MSAFSDKKQTETVTLGFDMSNLLVHGETLSTATFATSVKTGVDPAAAAMVSGTATIDGLKAMNKITAGVIGVVYEVEATVTTSNANIYVERGDLTVIA